MSAHDDSLARQKMLSRAMQFDFAHRGLFTRKQAPENSLGAAQAAVSLGFGIECDVRISADGVVCVFHDDDLKRLTGLSGRFESTGFEDLEKLSLEEVEGARIPKLSEWLAIVGGKVPLVIELKSFDEKGWFEPGRLEIGVLECLVGYRGDVLLKSFNPKSVQRLLELRGNAPWPIGTLSANLYRDGDFSFLPVGEAEQLSGLKTATAHESDFISYSVQDLTPELRFDPQWRDKPWMVWTVRTREHLQRARSLDARAIFESGVLDALRES